jgi:hypothetical protein
MAEVYFTEGGIPPFTDPQTTEQGETHMSGVLLDHTGNAEAINETEHRALKSHLSILRSLDYQEHQTVLGATIMDFEIIEKLKVAEHPYKPKPLLSAVVMGYVNDYMFKDGSRGALVSAHGEPDEELTESEIADLWDTLKTLRAGGWFAEWLEMQVRTIANGNLPDDKHPSPLKIVGTLVDAVDQFEKEIETARAMVTRRPDILIPAAKAPKPAPQPAQSPHKGPAPRKASARAHSKRSKATPHADAA